MRRISWIGIAILVLGVLLLAQNFVTLPFVIDFSIILPVLLLIFAVSSMVDSRRVSVFGTLLSLVAIYWLAGELGIKLPSLWGVLLPLLLIAAGFSILLPAASYRGRMQGGPSDFVSTAIFSGEDRTVGGDVFTNGTITAIFGGSDLRLLGFREFAPQASLYFTVLFGGCDVYIPRTVRVERAGLTCLFGGMDIKGHPFEDAQQTLVLHGIVMFGGLDINYLD